ncbi:isochorismatase family protein [Lysinibacillus agricola]|uniref:Isochorismatase family protein n=1 Tax=Lysinibacillus agricola TaxID=2590012 RepID=A0ABX7APZ1_9BACI|nr:MULTISPECIES: isochorismatase family protein [Lysinibacillus]KOS61907.1 isochorismatase [Lysinibacillus sp. FJAT-14222]QQP11285.1 isochorismatase family protein [Lysinibacillus agricola]
MFTTEEACLVVVDVQGKLATIVDESEAVIENVAKLVQAMQALEIPILWLEQNPNRLGGTALDIAQHLQGQAIAKMAFSACQEQEFVDALKASGRTQFIVTGIETHICVYQTARQLKEQGLEVEVVVDAVSSRTKANKEIGLEKMKALGILPTSTEMILYELLQHADHPHFKTVLQLVK